MRLFRTQIMSKPWQLALFAGAVMAAVPGCLVSVVEDEATIDGTWTVDGRPATAASCASLGVDTVQLNLYRGVGTLPYETLQAPCSAGIIDSRGLFDSYIEAGTYQYDFVAIRGGTEAGRLPRAGITLAAGDHGHVEADFSSGGFNPVGTDATGEATWTIDGAPATAANCAALGIASVRIAFQNGTEWFAHPGLTASCAAGRIDTRPNAVIRAGAWQMQVQALDATGAIVGPGMIESRNVTVGSHVVMQPTIFTSGAFMPLGTDASVAASWRLNARMPTSNACYAVGADRVRISLFAATDIDFENGVTVYQANCATGALDSGVMNVVRAGRYLWALEAVDSTGAIIVEYSESTPVDITVGSRVMFPTVDFMLPTTVTFDIGWTAPSGGAVTTCAAAGVQTMGYSLQRGVTIIDSSTSRPCADLMSWDSGAFATLTPGDYQLTVQGFNASGRKQWDVLPGFCTVTVGPLGLVATDCTAGFTP